MGIQLRRVAPLEVRDAVVQLFFRQRAWPFADESEYFKYWDWRYSSTSESPAAVWVAMDGGAVVGHIAVNFRRFHVDSHEVRVGVPANFLVDERYRSMMVAPLLARAPQNMVRRGELDLFLGYSNPDAHSISVALGCTHLGPMHCFVEVQNWSRVLARRIPGGELLAPLARLTARARRAITHRRSRAEHLEALSFRELSEHEVSALDRSHWKRTRALAWNGDGAYLVKRFLRCPFVEYRVGGIIDERSGQLEGVVITRGNSRLYVVQCETNEDVLSEVGAIDVAAAAMPEVEVIVVPLLPRTRLAADFLRAGFVARSGDRADPLIKRTSWCAFSLKHHPLAAAFVDVDSWKLWYGWGQH